MKVAAYIRPVPPAVITVFWDGGSKTFMDSYKARAFYAKQFKAGLHPKVSAQTQERLPMTTTEIAKPAEQAQTKPAPKKAAKPKKPAKAKAKATKKTGNLPLAEARIGVLKAVAKKRHTVSELRLPQGNSKTPLVPYGPYTSLLRGLVADGLIELVKNEGDRYRYIEITTKGRKSLEK